MVSPRASTFHNVINYQSTIVQLMEFVGVSSFKRKYPDLSRRAVEAHERTMLIRAGVVSETLAELGNYKLCNTIYDTLNIKHRTDSDSAITSTGFVAN